MQVQALSTTNYAANSKKQNKVAFRGTPGQILKAVDNAAICPGKKRFLSGLGGYFEEFQKAMSKIKDAPKEFAFKLGEKNEVPEALKKTEVNGMTLGQLDEALNEGAFKCSPTSSCACGAGQTKGGFAKSLLEMIGVPEAHVVKIVKD